MRNARVVARAKKRAHGPHIMKRAGTAGRRRGWGGSSVLLFRHGSLIADAAARSPLG